MLLLPPSRSVTSRSSLSRPGWLPFCHSNEQVPQTSSAFSERILAAQRGPVALICPLSCFLLGPPSLCSCHKPRGPFPQGRPAMAWDTL